jgi:multidrug efflux system membrane fusion protein
VNAPLIPILSLAVAAAGCGRGGDAPATAGPPPVTVAQPIAALVAEHSEHTGRAEAPETVEVRTRASGHLTRAPFREGDLVARGELLFVVDLRPYEAAVARARAELASVGADLERSRKDNVRAVELVRRGVVPSRELDTSDAEVAQLQARRKAAIAALHSAELDLEYATVRSPIAGRIGRMLVTPGNVVGPATALATVVSVDPLYVYLDVDEARALRLRRGAAVELGFPGDEGYPRRATVDFLDNRVDPGTGTLKVRAVVPNPDGALADGMFARARIVEGDPRAVALVADRAINTDQDRRFVWVLDEHDAAQYRRVELGALHEGLRVVRSGLTAADRVVVAGVQRVRPGIKVAPQLVPMTAVERETARADVRR